MPVLVPMINVNEAFEFTVALDEVVYTLSVRWNSRMENWIFDLFIDDDQPVQTGNTFIVNVPLLFQNQRTIKFPGMLMAINTAENEVNPDRWTIGGDVKLYYYTEDEIESGAL